MSLYPTTLFHFTSKEFLYQILESTFKVSYAREKIIGPVNNREFAVPMVSFCDLKLSELKFFLNYGKFGIGLTKDWANKNGLSPVMYINRHCQLMDNLISGITGIYSHLSLVENINQFNNLNKSYLNVMNTYRYIKNYEGELWRQGRLENENYRFADEREWRFVPQLDTEGVAPFVGISKIRSKKQKEFYNNKVNQIRLNFSPDDIKYLVVEKDSDITELINYLHSVKIRFDEETRNRLASRILTVEQIEKDI
ncbi:abortive infection system antitoxin AbiGi family protein [Flavobacterium chuncheonense]|uniref:Abortive infection system antitoxin AbiGi family protein n=1 Tax=Flavobacterium chuncheonense TaxID=2026653 RepID=A0ABW5YJI9_9FLAO